MKNETVAMLLAGGQGTRLYDLTSTLAKPAVEYGGRFRIIDFPLSNCTHSDISTVGILTQYQPLLLNNYINGGGTWNLDDDDGGVHILPPYKTSDEDLWFKGTAHAIWANYQFIDSFNPEYVLILSGDHIYNMDYSKMIDVHKESGNDLTICVKQVPIKEAFRFGIMTVDDKNNIIDFVEKPQKPTSDLASMGIYVFNKSVLYHYLSTEVDVEGTEFDFGKNIIPRMMNDNKKIGAYQFKGYWKDVGTIESLWEANMDLLNPKEDAIINDPNWRIYSKTPALHPSIYANASVLKSALVANGCIISGTIESSIVSYKCTVGGYTVVKNSVIQSNVTIGTNVELDYVLVKSGTTIPDHAKLKGKRDNILLVTNSYFENQK